MSSLEKKPSMSVLKALLNFFGPGCMEDFKRGWSERKVIEAAENARTTTTVRKAKTEDDNCQTNGSNKCYDHFKASFADPYNPFYSEEDSFINPYSSFEDDSPLI